MTDSAQQDAEKKEQKPRHRSPNYPSIGLKTAVGKIKALYKEDGLAPSPKLAAIKHMGYEKLHSDAARTLSALKGFGLLEENDERLKLTQRGIDIVAREEGDQRRVEAIRAAALSPDIYKELTTYYAASGMPSDTTLRSELIAVRKFNPDSVDGMIRAFKETLEFADLSKGKVIESEQPQDEVPDSPAPLKVGDFVQWEVGGQIQFAEPRRIREFSTDGKWAFVDGSATGMNSEELTKMEATEVESQPPVVATLGPNGKAALQQHAGAGAGGPKVSQMRSYSWALSGDFNAKMELFGEAGTEEDLDALKDYVDITIKALKRSMKSPK